MADGFFRSKKGFTVVQNSITRNCDVSLKAKGLYLVIQSSITLPDKKWRKEEFQAMTCEGKKAFESAWNELKEKGYLKVHMYSKGTTWAVEYELLDEAREGAHTYYYNAKGELTRTNIERAAAKAEQISAKNTLEEKNLRYPHFGSNGNGSNGNGCNGNGGNNNKAFEINTENNNGEIKTSIPSYLSSKEEEEGLRDEFAYYTSIIKANIDYEALMEYFDPEECQRFDEMYQIIRDVVCVQKEYVRVNGKDYPHALVKEQFLKLKKEHLEYVEHRMKTNHVKVENMRAYLITALYNAPTTICNHVAQEFRANTGEEYVSANEMDRRAELKKMQQLRDENPEAYQAFLRQKMKERGGEQSS